MTAVIFSDLNIALDRDGVTLSQVEIDAYIDGVMAAPTLPDHDWITLLGEGISEQTRALLIAYLAAAQKKYDPGFPQGHAPKSRLVALRNVMAELEIDAFLVPRTDEFLGEYVAAYADRLHWLTGFSGSAGLAIIMQDKAAIFVDGRYEIQVVNEIDPTQFEICPLSKIQPVAWLKTQIQAGQKLGIDPWLHSAKGFARYEGMAKECHLTLTLCPDNPVDKIWHNQPARPLAPIKPHPIKYSGRSSHDKIRDLAADLKKKAVDLTVITASDNIAWLLNIRGGDVARCPLSLSYALLSSHGRVSLFIDQRKISASTKAYLANLPVSVAEIDSFASTIKHAANAGKTLLFDPVTSPYFVKKIIQDNGGRLVMAEDPCQIAKACKNNVELQGMRQAHIRDGAMMVRFLKWVEESVKLGDVTEMAIADKITTFRQQDPLFRDLSFDTISASGPHGAICHYRVSEKVNRTVNVQDILLVDSGGQYLDGTTDITRTLCFAPPAPHIKDHFTRVLQGHIQLASCRFPENSSGAQLDVLARTALWQVGLDFDHGTGHGVGSYLNVHEGPQRIAKGADSTALMPGMIVSNEPGFYQEGQYGIRIENLIVVQPAANYPGFLEFETITFAPIATEMIDVALLSPLERDWINSYHDQVWQNVSPLLDQAHQDWLKQKTQPLHAV